MIHFIMKANPSLVKPVSSEAVSGVTRSGGHFIASVRIYEPTRLFIDLNWILLAASQR